MKNGSWLIFLGLGLLIVAFSLYSLLFLPANVNSGDQLNWLTSDAEVLEFVGWNFRIQGAWQLAFGAMVIITAVTGLRRREQWAWYALWSVPLMLVLVTVFMIWIIPFTAVLFLIAAGALLLSRPMFSPPQGLAA
jgi:hypothetical protein